MGWVPLLLGLVGCPRRPGGLAAPESQGPRPTMPATNTRHPLAHCPLLRLLLHSWVLWPTMQARSTCWPTQTRRTRCRLTGRRATRATLQMRQTSSCAHSAQRWVGGGRRQGRGMDGGAQQGSWAGAAGWGLLGNGKGGRAGSRCRSKHVTDAAAASRHTTSFVCICMRAPPTAPCPSTPDWLLPWLVGLLCVHCSCTMWRRWCHTRQMTTC